MTVAAGLAQMRHVGFRVRSKVRPWTGTFADVDRAARSLAAALHARGVRAGDVVAFQLPNWVEAGITFWAAAYVGAVVVPIVHFYGAKEVDYIVRATEPKAVVSADYFGASDCLSVYEEVCTRHSVPTWLAVQTRDGSLPSAAMPLGPLFDHEPLPTPTPIDPASPAIVA